MTTSTKKIHLFILAVTSIIFSRAMFFFFDDPEGTNLLVTTVMAVMLYFVTVAIYFSKLAPAQLTSRKRLFLVIIIQIILITSLYFCLK